MNKDPGFWSGHEEAAEASEAAPLSPEDELMAKKCAKLVATIEEIIDRSARMPSALLGSGVMACFTDDQNHPLVRMLVESSSEDLFGQLLEVSGIDALPEGAARKIMVLFIGTMLAAALIKQKRDGTMEKD